MDQLDTYEVLNISDDEVLEREQLGSKSKFWVSIGHGEEEQDWLFKIPRENTGEHWAEKVAEQIATLLEIEHAVVELAEYTDTKGSCSKSFINKEKKPELIHGNEILSGRVLGYEKDKRYGQSSHTYNNIRKAIIETGSDSEAQRALKNFAGYIVLDGLIGNTDRHHENWAFLKWTDRQNQTHHVLAPTFDHASSLGRELLDEKRKLILKEDRVEWYIERGQGAIFADPENKKGLNPFKLVEFACKEHPAIFRPWLEVVDELNPNEFEKIINNIPGSFITDFEKVFALKMLKINLEKLTNLKP